MVLLLNLLNLHYLLCDDRLFGGLVFGLLAVEVGICQNILRKIIITNSN